MRLIPYIKTLFVNIHSHQNGSPTPKTAAFSHLIIASNVLSQAPMCVSSLFNNTQQIVYGYSQNCRGATLFANIGEQELDTLVSCAELNVTQVGCDN